MGLDFVRVPFKIACLTTYLKFWHKKYCAVLRFWTYPSSRFPLQRCHRERCSVSRALLCPSIDVPSKPSPPPCSPLGPLWREMLISRAFLYISFNVPVKDPPPSGSPCRAWIEGGRERGERDTPFPEPSICASRVPSKWAPVQIPQQGPYGERCPFSEPSFTYFLERPMNHVSWWNKISPSSQSSQ